MNLYVGKKTRISFLRLYPDYAQAMNNLGNLLKDKARYRDAEELFLRAIELQ